MGEVLAPADEAGRWRGQPVRARLRAGARRRGRGPGVHGRPPPQGVVLREDLLREHPQPGARIEAELAREQPPHRLVGVERIALAPRAVEREHQVRVELFAQRVLRDQRAGRRDHVEVAPQRQQRLQPGLVQLQVELVEPGGLRGGPGVRRHVGERLAAPERERLGGVLQRAVGPECGAGAGQRGGRADQLGEAVRVDRGVGDGERVARCPAHEQGRALGAERPAQVGDEAVHRVRDVGRRGAGPEPVRDDPDRDGGPRLGEQEHQQRARQAGADRDRRSVGAHLQRSQDREVHGR
nr:hypothetical protein [Pseudonocardia humida]